MLCVLSWPRGHFVVHIMYNLPTSLPSEDAGLARQQRIVPCITVNISKLTWNQSIHALSKQGDPVSYVYSICTHFGTNVVSYMCISYL